MRLRDKKIYAKGNQHGIIIGILISVIIIVFLGALIKIIL